MLPKTMFEKIWDAHVVHQDPGQDAILYVDLHLVHEVTSPQAFEGLRLSGRPVRRPELTVATVDHSIPTWERTRPTEGPYRRAADRHHAAERERQPSAVLRHTQRRAGHRPRDRTSVGIHQAGNAHRMRGQSHVHPRGLRVDGHGNRDHAGRARSRHPVRPAGQPEDHGSSPDRQPAPGSPLPRTSS